MLGWLADVFRGAWGLWCWNIRKTVFRLSGGQRSCPCQNPSDSGEAGNLPDRDRVALLLDAQAARVDVTGRRNLIDRVPRAGIDGPSLDLLVAHAAPSRAGYHPRAAGTLRITTLNHHATSPHQP